MKWEVEYTDELGAWWANLSEAEQESVDFSVRLLGEKGPNRGTPPHHSSGIETSKHAHMRELRVQHEGRPYRVLYAFDPRRSAILLIGATKPGIVAGMKPLCRWQTGFTTPISIHLDTLKKEGRTNG